MGAWLRLQRQLDGSRAQIKKIDIDPARKLTIFYMLFTVKKKFFSVCIPSFSQKNVQNEIFFKYCIKTASFSYAIVRKYWSPEGIYEVRITRQRVCLCRLVLLRQRQYGRETEDHYVYSLFQPFQLTECPKNQIRKT